MFRRIVNYFDSLGVNAVIIMIGLGVTIICLIVILILLLMEKKTGDNIEVSHVVLDYRKVLRSTPSYIKDDLQQVFKPKQSGDTVNLLMDVSPDKTELLIEEDTK